MLRKILSVTALLIIAGFIGFSIGKKYFQKPREIVNTQPMRVGQSGLTNPLLDYETSTDIYGPSLIAFDTEIKEMVDKMTSEGKVDTISVYFRSLNDGPWFGIHENTNYFPASLLKVPIMIAYFKKAESDPSILDKKIYYDPGILKTLGDFNNGEYYPAKEVIMPGQSYTVIDLINRMIEFSDNNAKNLLEINFDSPNELYKVYIDLGFVTPPELRGGGDVLSVHEYASFYRVLYNASYLNQEYSEKALEILSKTDFKRGISESVPNNITISHKFGEYSDNNFKQLHDCGIIYYPKSPYILCVLTRGSDFSNLESVISTISDTVYKEVDKQTKAGSQW